MTTRIAILVAGLTLFPLLAVPAHAQTRKVTVHLNPGTAAGNVRVLSGASGTVGSCPTLGANPCTVFVNQGADIVIAADYPGRLSAGTGPAAACALSTCSFTMTADADVTATFTAGDGPFATVTTTLAGGGSGRLSLDGKACQSGSCAVKYLVGSSIHLVAAAVGTARFTGYSSGTGNASACGSPATCTFTLSGDSSVTGTFRALTSFFVAPSSAAGVPGGPAQTFTATGTYSDGATVAIAAGQGAWSAAPPMPFGARAEALAGAALGGKVYALGGLIAHNVVQNRLSEFDPGSQTWTERAPMLVPRDYFAAVPVGGKLYAIGGLGTASVERYDPATDTWTMRAPMSAARAGLVAGSVNGIIYAAGGGDNVGNPVATLEAYDPVTNMWTTKAPMPTPRSGAVGGVIDGILYVAGGSDGTAVLSTVLAYDPATNTWSARAPLPVPLFVAPAATVADGVLYVMSGVEHDHSVVYAYDPAADAWSVRTPMLTPRIAFAAASLDGIVYAMGGQTVELSPDYNSDIVETFVDGLRWSSSAPAAVRVDQNGVASPLAPGIATIVANVGVTTCGVSCPTFTVIGPTSMALDSPVDKLSLPAGSELTIAGWAFNSSAPFGTGVDAIHVYAYPTAGSPIFLGVAAYGESRTDVGAAYGSQFTNSGFTLKTSVLPGGAYTIVASAHNALTGAFDAHRTAGIVLTNIAVDTPTANQVLTSAFEVGGWALDTAAPTGTGVDAVQCWVIPSNGLPVFIGNASYGSPRPDVAAVFGSRFTNVGWHFTITGLGPDTFTLEIRARSSVTGTFSIIARVPFSVSATALMSIDAPSPEAAFPNATFGVAGWSIDRTVESTAIPGTGVDQLHVYAYPNPGSGTPPIFLGFATTGISRPDVGAYYGSRYTNSGYVINIDRAALGLTPGVYNIVVHSHSAVSGTFNNQALVRVTLQ